MVSDINLIYNTDNNTCLIHRHENIKASEEKFVILGGCDGAEPGTFATHVKVDRDYLHLSPDHLSDEQVAAFPLAGVTAWR